MVHFGLFHNVSAPASPPVRQVPLSSKQFSFYIPVMQIQRTVGFCVKSRDHTLRENMRYWFSCDCLQLHLLSCKQLTIILYC